MKGFLIPQIGVLACLLFLTACGGPNLAQRIDTGMREFDSWPMETQHAVREGRIEVGFTKEQVRMAWGEPDYVTREVRGDGEAERWVWEKKTPRIGIGVGVGSSSRRSGVGGSVGTSVGGDRRVKRAVWFEGDRVVSFSE